MKVGETELITMPMISDQQREARREDDDADSRAARSARSGIGRRRSGCRRTRRPGRSRTRPRTCGGCTSMHPDLTRTGVAAMHERVKWLWANDPEWRASRWRLSFASVRAAYDTGPGLRPLLDRVERHVVRQLARARDVRVADRPGHRVRDAQGARQRADVRLLLRRRLLGDGRDGPVARVLRREVRRPAVRRRHPRGLPVPGRAPLATAHAENGDPIVSIEPVGTR